MDVSNRDLDVLELEELMRMELLACNICSQCPINPVFTNCCHLFCWMCLDEAFEGQQARPCPICGDDLLGETAHNFPIQARLSQAVSPATSTPAEPTSGGDEAASDTPPVRRFPLHARLEDFLNQEKHNTQTQELKLYQALFDVRGERISDLEQVVENLAQMNSTLLGELEECNREKSEMSRRIVELENQIVRVGIAIATTPPSELGTRNGQAPTVNAGHSGSNDVESVVGMLLATD